MSAFHGSANSHHSSIFIIRAVANIEELMHPSNDPSLILANYRLSFHSRIVALAKLYFYQYHTIRHLNILKLGKRVLFALKQEKYLSLPPDLPHSFVEWFTHYS